MQDKISIHAPTRGATQLCNGLAGVNAFQSTLPQGERRQSASRKSTPYQFQSTLPQGERLGLAKKGYWVGGFQSTLPQGERPRWLWRWQKARLNFNPRSHKGSDAYDLAIPSTLKTISIHAPTRGAPNDPHDHKQHGPFQSTLPQGERPMGSMRNPRRS